MHLHLCSFVNLLSICAWLWYHYVQRALSASMHFCTAIYDMRHLQE